MLSFTDVTLRRGPRKLLEAVSFMVYPGWRVGVVGRNGTGKTSLFAMIAGDLAPDAGEVSLPKGLSIATVTQELQATPQAAIDYVLDGDTELRATQIALAEAETVHDAGRISHLHDKLNAIGGYAARARAAKLLDGLGFAPAEQTRAVAEFSGGWRMRLNLAQALMHRSDLALLDEPTNHLDLDAVIWLQSWLVAYAGTLLVISHDREFLDAVTTHTLHLHHGRAQLYTGNYSQFERLCGERLAREAALHEQQKKRIAHLQSFVDRFRAKATKAKQAQARLKMIERIKLAAPVHADAEFAFCFPVPKRLPSPLIRMEDAKVGYGHRTVLSNINISLEPGDRIALLGPNGAGKSTFMKLLAGLLAPRSGNMLRDSSLTLGYFAQHQLEQLDPHASPLAHLLRLDSRAPEQTLRDYLGGFNFRGDRVFEATVPFSGGEKARLALALVVYRRPNLLLLDEPANHLDLDLRHALEVALQDFPGALVLVAHDRHLIGATCDTSWRVVDGHVTPFEGDLDDYARWLTIRSRRSSEEDTGDDSTKPSAKAQRRLAAQRREQARKLDTRMAALQKRLTEIEQELTDPEIYEEGARSRFAALLQEQGELKKQLIDVEEDWLAAAEELETLKC